MKLFFVNVIINCSSDRVRYPELLESDEWAVRIMLLKFTRELEVDSKIHFVIKPNFCQHNAGRYILDKMWTVFVAYITINNDSELFRASKTFVNTSVDSENCSSRNRHENTFLSQTEQNEFLSTHSAWYILDKKSNLYLIHTITNN